MDILVKNVGVELSVEMAFLNNTEADWGRGWRVDVKSDLVVCSVSRGGVVTFTRALT